MDFKRFIHKNAFICPWCGYKLTVKEKGKMNPQYPNRYKCKNCNNPVCTSYWIWLIKVFVVGAAAFAAYHFGGPFPAVVIGVILIMISYLIDIYLLPIKKKDDGFFIK